jgi:capsular exopolysaccharide synthesis family protein
LCLGLLFAPAAGVGAWFLLSAKYTAFARLYVASSPLWIVSRNADVPEATRDFLTYLKTQADSVRSRPILYTVLQREDVRTLPSVVQQVDPVLWLEETLKVETQENSEFINVSLSGPNPEELVVLVNALTEVYLGENHRLEEKRRAERVQALEKILTDTRENLRKKKNELRGLADQFGTTDKGALTQKQLNLLAEFGELKKQLSQVQIERMRAEMRLEAHKATEKNQGESVLVPETAVNQALETDAVGKDHLTRIARLEEVISDYEANARYPEKESTYIRARQRVESHKKALSKRRQELRVELAKGVGLNSRAEYHIKLSQLEQDLLPLARQEEALRKEVDKLKTDAEKVGTSSTTVEMLREEIKVDEQFSDKVGAQLDQLRVELQSPHRVNLYQEAGLQKKDTKKQLAATILAPLGVLGCICLTISWLEFRLRRIRTAEEVIKGLGMRVMGAVPDVPQASRRLLVGTAAEQGSGEHLLESIDSIRTVLLRDASVTATRIVMVTSAIAGEGKTTLASHLASSLAHAGRRTLLIDCDLRRPAAHQMFELPLQPGFSEVMLEEVHVAEATMSTAVSGLWVIPAGQWDREVLQALAKGGLEQIFDKLRAEYDFIVVDSHPVLTGTDSLLIGQHVDAVIFSLLRDVSQTPRVYAAYQRLAALGIRVLGAVVNGSREEGLYGSGYPAAAVTAGA